MFGRVPSLLLLALISSLALDVLVSAVETLGTSPRVSFFACPKGYDNKRTVPNEELAIRSWLALEPRPEVTLIEAREGSGLEKFCAKFGVRKVTLQPNDLTRLRAPKVRSIFKAGESSSPTDTVMYINSDILLPGNFMKVLDFVYSQFPAAKHRDLMIVGGRTDCENTDLGTERVAQELSEAGEVDTARVEARMSSCKPAGEGAKDYFVFRKKFFQEKAGGIPPFAIGRGVWDSWILKIAHYKGFAVDVSPVVVALHMNHDYSHGKGFKVSADKKIFTGSDGLMNKKLETASLKKAKVAMPKAAMGNLRVAPAYRVCPSGPDGRGLALQRTAGSRPPYPTPLDTNALSPGWGPAGTRRCSGARAARGSPPPRDPQGAAAAAAALGCRSPFPPAAGPAPRGSIRRAAEPSGRARSVLTPSNAPTAILATKPPPFPPSQVSLSLSLSPLTGGRGGGGSSSLCLLSTSGGASPPFAPSLPSCVSKALEG
eukprot:CAMPEP_0177586662 /NCGR_PEP_ID=MMETSP0419_2-20121207/5196_1 /TAXON_ID=582737 /ORGANISM="Tetraselmis sp., Strain GSL018" /LENGTH=485 /DNA_ID=CAMNT_0019076577 /DNA_START=340 /DNA_END=1795 /DNA_ORIENTATION=+